MIDKSNLSYLKQYKPIILSLDDIEMFWAVTDQKNILYEFISSLIEWRNCMNKGSYLYNFSNFITDNKIIKNESYLKIFNHNNLSSRELEIES